MGLPWVRLETTWPSNPKFLTLVGDKQWRAITVYMGGLAWSGGQGMDGFIPTYALPMIHGTKRDADVLIEARLWVPAQGGWDINDWREYQPSNEEHQRRAERARAAAQKRWANRS